MSAEPLQTRLGHEWLRGYAGLDYAPQLLAEFLGHAYPPAGSEISAHAVALDMGLYAAHIVPLEPVQASDGGEGVPEVTRQWRLAEEGEPFAPAIIVPVSLDYGRAYYEPGDLTLSLATWGAKRFAELVCDLVAIPLAGGARPLSYTGMTVAIGRFAKTERDAVRIFATGMGWLKDHLERARGLDNEMPAHLVAQIMAPIDSHSTLLLEPEAIEWRPSRANCPLPAGTETVIVCDSAGLARVIDVLSRKKDKPVPAPKVFGPKEPA